MTLHCTTPSQTRLELSLSLSEPMCVAVHHGAALHVLSCKTSVRLIGLDGSNLWLDRREMHGPPVMGSLKHMQTSPGLRLKADCAAARPITLLVQSCCIHSYIHGAGSRATLEIAHGRRTTYTAFSTRAEPGIYTCLETLHAVKPTWASMASSSPQPKGKLHCVQPSSQACRAQLHMTAAGSGATTCTAR